MLPHQMLRTMSTPRAVVKKRNVTRKRGRTMYPGIVEDAALLGVHRSSLYRALTRKWVLPDLVNRYQALQAKRKPMPVK